MIMRKNFFPLFWGGLDPKLDIYLRNQGLACPGRDNFYLSTVRPKPDIKHRAP